MTLFLHVAIIAVLTLRGVSLGAAPLTMGADHAEAGVLCGGAFTVQLREGDPGEPPVWVVEPCALGLATVWAEPASPSAAMPASHAFSAPAPVVGAPPLVPSVRRPGGARSPPAA